MGYSGPAMQRTGPLLTISVPPEMFRELKRVRREEFGTRLKLVREALRVCFSSRISEQLPTAAE